MNIHRGMLARIKHKCLITMLSIMELRETDYAIMNRMRRTIPLNVLADSMTEVYKLFMKIYRNHYFSDCFNHVEKKIDLAKPCTDEDEFIFELGFNYYIIIFNVLQNINKATFDADQQEIWDLIKEFNQPIDKSDMGFLEGSVLGDLIKLFKQLFSELIGSSLDAIKSTGGIIWEG